MLKINVLDLILEIGYIHIFKNVRKILLRKINLSKKIRLIIVEGLPESSYLYIKILI